MLAFKIMNDPFVGSLTFAASTRASSRTGTVVMNSVKDKRERVGRMLLMHANNREDIEEAFAGDIVALAGLKETTTGDTLCDPLKPVILERMEFPEPVIQIAIEPKTKADQEKMGLALNRLAAEDPSFRVKTDQEAARPSSRAWANFTSTSWSTACAANSRSKPTSARRRLPTAKPSRARRRRLHPQEAVRWYRSVRPRQDHLRTEPGRARLQVRIQDRRRLRSEGIHPRRQKGIESVLLPVRSLASRCSASRRRSSTVPSTTSTRRPGVRNRLPRMLP
jgi:hypothetical protein